MAHDLSDYSSTSDDDSYEESSEYEEEAVRNSGNPLVWVGAGNKQQAIILFRPESIITSEKKLKSIGEKYHMAYKMVKTESKLVRSILQAYGFHEVHPNCPDFNLMWTGAHLKPFSLRSLSEFQRVNHFPRSYEITRKDRIYKNIDRMSHSKGAKHFDFIPKSYLMPSEYQDFCAAYAKERGQWIVKPIASSRGRGIYLINNPNQVPLEDNIMVCKYIHNPLLIDGFKFDVRVYVAVTSYDPLIIYLYEEGLTRFATVKYERANRNIKNQMMHLTNYSINKKSLDYVRCDDPDVEDYGNKWSMSAMLRYLKQEGIDTTLLMARIEAVIIKSIVAAELPIATACRMFVPHRENCIELYGFDILIDDDLKPWLLEGNLSPSLACDAPLDLKIKSSVVSDFFSLAGFRCIDPIAKRQAKKGENKRPVSASKSGSMNSNGGGSKRPNSASKEILVSSNGLSQEETRVLRMVKDQYQRRGGFIRIFPTVDTWEQYSSFLEYKTTFNQLLAQKLFGSSYKHHHVSLSRARNGGGMVEGRNHIISKHVLQYERKLMALDPHKRKTNNSKKRTRKPPTPVGVDTKPTPSRKSSASHKSRASNSTQHINEVSSADINDDSDTPSVTPSSTTVKVRQKKASTASSSTVASITSSERSNNSSKSNTKPITNSAAPPASANIGKAKSTDSMSSTISDASSSSSSSAASSVGNDATDSSGGGRDQDDKSSVVTNCKGDCAPSKHNQQRVYNYKSLPSQQQQQQTTQQQSKIKASTDGGAAVLKQGKQQQQQSKLTQGQVAAKKKSETILEQLKSGANLSKVQARHAFSAYLSRVQYRLMFESDGSYQCLPEVLAKQEEQMDLVLRFLKRAAGNLRQSFAVTIPSHKLPINERKRILAKQLGEFVHIYNRETENMMQSNQLDGGGADGKGGSKTIAVSEFKAFVSAATETELEEILTTYTHRNKSASVFLGASRSSTSASKNVAQTSHEADKKLHHNNSPYNSNHHQRSYSMHDQGELIKHNGDDDYHHYNHNNGSMYVPDRSKTASSSYAAAAGANGGFYHGQTISNEEAIADALQRLSERQAARKYQATSHLGQHLTLTSLGQPQQQQQRHLTSAAAAAALIQQRASSLPDLANADPCIQSMMDPAVRGGEASSSDACKPNTNFRSARSYSSMKKLASGGGSNDGKMNHSQMLAQQSRELLQQSKAKHLAMVAQVHNNPTSTTNNNNGGSKPPNSNHYMSYFPPSNKIPQAAAGAMGGSSSRGYSTSGGLHMLPPTPPLSTNWGDNRAFMLRKTMGAMRRPNSSMMSSSGGYSTLQKQDKSRHRTLHNYGLHGAGGKADFKH